MTATAHAVIGASIAKVLPNPYLGLPLALISHFIVDKIPHWDPMTDKAKKTKRLIWIETLTDVAVSFILVAILANFFWTKISPSYLFLSAFVSQLPDWLEVPYVFFQQKITPFYQIYLGQKWIHDVWFDARLSAPWGVIIQLLVMAIFVVWAA